MKTLILGLGNDIMSDDAAGLLVSREIGLRIAPGSAEVVESAYAGWRLIDILRGFERVIMIDAIVSDECLPGQVCAVDLDNIRSMHLQSSHGMGIREALAMGAAFAAKSGDAMPGLISAYAVGVKNPFEFGSRPCAEVSVRIGAIASEIIERENLSVIQSTAL